MKKNLLALGVLLLLAGFIYAATRFLPGFIDDRTNRIHFIKETFASQESVTARVDIADPRKVDPTIFNSQGKETGVMVEKKKDGNQTLLTFTPPISFQPGKYTLKIKNGDKTYEQNFNWGVLALNTDKSIYLPGETGHIHFGVLDEKGMMVCNANIELRIKNQELNIDEILSTSNGKIKVNPECKIKDFVQKPDYETTYQFTNTGTYTLTLTATHKNGTYTITDEIKVQDSVPFDITRTSNTRIYPINKYPMTFTITANQDFDGEIVERVPMEFKINNILNSDKPFNYIHFNKKSSQSYRYQEVVWKVALKKGQTYTYGYSYDAPDVSPYFYITGQLEFFKNNKKIFAENRSWQIANDDVVNAVEQEINITDQEYSSTSQTASPTNNSLGLIEFDGSKYNGESVYFEADVQKDESYASDGDIGYYPQIQCFSATDCKMVYIDEAQSSIRFKDCDDATCSTGVITILDGDTGCVITNCQPTEDMSSVSSPSLSMYCVSATDCKIVYLNFTEWSLYFLDCDDAQCATGTTTKIDGGSGCALSGCSTTNWVGEYPSIDCSAGANDCKISYRDYNPASAAIFADCDNATCTSGTRSILDGYTGCVITGCSTTIATYDTAIACNGSSTDCKVTYFDDTNDDLLFLDCDNATCTSATRTVVDGGASCGLTNCATSDARGKALSMDCLSASDCKLVYAIGNSTDLVFADCDDATCSTGTVTIPDGTTGCTLTGCSTTHNAGDHTSIDCSNGATDCKIVYVRNVDLYFADCDDATCSSGTATLLDGNSPSCSLTGCVSSASYVGYYGATLDCSSGASDCKIVYLHGQYNDVYFADCAAATCSSGSTASIDGSGGGNQELGEYIAMDCPTADNCKIVYREEVGSSSTDQLRFMDCDDVTCSTGTMSVIDGAECTITNCSNGTGSWNEIGLYISVDCVATDDCKVVYTNYAADLFFIDCDDRACSSGTRTMPDGASGCTLTGCSTSAFIWNVTGIDCVTTDDCKIAYSVNSTSHDIYFADCDTATCSAGTRTLLNGGTSCVLTGCNTGLTTNVGIDIYCIATDNCKISHFDSGGGDLWFLDCDSATCGTGTASMIDGDASCPLSGCSTSATNTGQYNAIDCTGGSTDCKVAYQRASDLYFADCDNSTCTSGTTTHADGSTGCVLTGCTNNPYNLALGLDLDCLNGVTDCKVVYYSSQANLKFADCDNATCSSGTSTFIDGYNTSCPLTNCDPALDSNNDRGKQASIDCVGGAADCKISYRDYLIVGPDDILFADCNNAPCTSGSVQTADDGNEKAWIELYDSAGNKVKDAILMASSESYSRLRTSVPITLSDNTNYSVRMRSSHSSTTAYVKAARLIIPQNPATLTDTQTQIEVGNNDTTTSTSYELLTDHKIWNFQPDKFSDTPTIYFEASLANSGANTTYAALSTSPTCASTVAGSEVTSTGTTWALSRSSAITLSDTEYWVCIKTSAGTGSIANAKVIIDQSDASGIDYLQTYKTLINTASTDSDSTYTSQDFLTRFGLDNYDGGYQLAMYHEATMKTSAGTGYTQVYNRSASGSVSNSELSTTSTSYERKRSIDISDALPATDENLDSQIKNSATNTTTISNSWLIIEYVPPPPDTNFEGVNLEGVDVN